MLSIQPILRLNIIDGACITKIGGSCKLMDIAGGGSVINGAIMSSFSNLVLITVECTVVSEGFITS